MRVIIICIVVATFSAIAVANQGHLLLLSQTRDERATTIAGILHTSKKACEAVSRTFLQGTDQDEASYWNAECTDGASYVIQLTTTNQTRVIECEVVEDIMKRTGNGRPCFTRFE